MRICIKSPVVERVLVVLIYFVLARVSGQTFATLQSFTVQSTGENPIAGLVLSGSTLYGTTLVGGSFADGTVFKVNTNGTGFAALHNFSAGGSDGVGAPNDDGAFPRAPLAVSGETLYGTARHGPSGWGTVFAINTNGTGFTNLYNFSGGSDGAQPDSGLVLSGNVLYGTASSGGEGYGTLFSMQTDGTGFTVLHSFTGATDGANPICRLVLSGSTLYGVTSSGGTWAYGAVFSVQINGTSFNNLYSFPPLDQTYNTNNEGAWPSSGLLLSGNTLYGTATAGGTWGNGAIFRLNTDGSGFAALHSFSMANTNSMGVSTNNDGMGPSDLVLPGKTLYGTAGRGGPSGNGTVFKINTDGTAFSALHNFPSGIGQGGPNGELAVSGNALYGTTKFGGTSGAGTIFSIALPAVQPPQLTITAVRGNVIVAWPTNAAGFILQSTTNLGPSANWTTNLPAPVLVNGFNTVTNPILGTQQFFRLSQ